MKMIAGFVLLLILGSGCISLGKSKPSSFYVLSSVADSARAANAEAPPSGIRVGVLKANLPQTLARPQIVTYPAPNQIRFSETDRWGEPLEDGMTRVIMENLGLMIPSREVYMLPARSTQAVDRYVAVDVIRFGYIGEDAVELAARWTVYEEDRETVLDENAVRISEILIVENPEELDYRILAERMSRTLLVLSREIAAAIRESTN